MTPKPFVQGPQTALVVGKTGEEIWVDKYGRIKVQFYWDRLGKKGRQKFLLDSRVAALGRDPTGVLCGFRVLVRKSLSISWKAIPTGRSSRDVSITPNKLVPYSLPDNQTREHLYVPKFEGRDRVEL